MKKIYSYVLMAAMLLIGADAWAFSGTTRAELQAAIDAAASGATVTLENDVTLDGPIWLGTETLEESAKSITLDLNGHDVKMTGAGGACYMFVLTHGELLVQNSQSTTSNITLSGSSNGSTQIFSVYGSYRSSRWNADGNALVADSINTRVNGYISHLEIGERIKITAGTNCLGAGLVIDCAASGNACATAATLNGKTLKYFTNIYNSGYGYAYGARIDLKGEVEIIGISSSDYKAYGIKVNGTVRSPQEELPIRTTKMNGVDNNYLINYVANRDNAGNGHCKDTIDAPYVEVHSTARIVTNNGSTRSAAIYASGFAKWLIAGHCEGNIGVSASSGLVALNDAEIASTATTYTPPTGGNGVSGSGSGIIINSRTGYSGDIDVTISGSTTVTADAGYGIEEAVTTKDGKTKVDAVTITGGTISGGDAGTVLVTETSAENENGENGEGGKQTNITITGVSIVVDEDADDPVQIGSDNLQEFLEKQAEAAGEETHTTEITNADGSKTVVISDGAAPSGSANVAAEHDANSSVKWTGASENITADLTLKELEINEATAQILTVKTGNTLSVGRVVLGNNAQIIVEPGATFIVTGEQGVVAPKVSNILLKTSADNPARFLFNPNVKSNVHPKATIEYVTKSWWEDGSHYQWERFGTPGYSGLESITCDKVGDDVVYVEIQVYANQAWTSLGYIGGTYSVDNTKLNKPFTTYNMLAYRAKNETAPTVRMTGALVGNGNATLTASQKWAPFANSYTADVDVYTMLNTFESTASPVSPDVYVATPQGLGQYAWDALDVESAAEDNTKLKPMQAFMLLNRSHVVADRAINYKSMVYDPAVGGAPAPSRGVVADDNTAKLRVIVTNEEGLSDNVKLRENAVNKKAVEKYMNDDVNIYVMADEKCAIVADENLEDTYLGFSTVNGGNFTISFAKVDGREFDLVDLETNARVAVTEGQTYTFSAARNTTADYRFKLVERKKVMTDVDKIGTDKNAKGIYTIMGQYVGEMNLWNTLPAGIYVVDGEKRVK